MEEAREEGFVLSPPPPQRHSSLAPALDEAGPARALLRVLL